MYVIIYLFNLLLQLLLKFKFKKASEPHRLHKKHLMTGPEENSWFSFPKSREQLKFAGNRALLPSDVIDFAICPLRDFGEINKNWGHFWSAQELKEKASVSYYQKCMVLKILFPLPGYQCMGKDSRIVFTKIHSLCTTHYRPRLEERFYAGGLNCLLIHLY